ncbi:MAG: sugar phosphate isomerase/epimerase [Candidatus Omnitrophica bacterium]|nr:sugar phosphate isomerase/epimerase [Candidatus Omnitrophota bacterium]
MKISKKDFLVQVKYADIPADVNRMDECFSGFGGELYLSPEEMLNHSGRIMDNIKTFSGERGLALRLHAPVLEIDYSQPAESLARMAPVYENARKLCRFLDISSVVAHAELDRIKDFPLTGRMENAAFIWDSLVGIMSGSGIGINIENHCEAEPSLLIGIFKKISSKYLGMCIDPGHFNVFSELSAEEWIESYPPGSIREVHLADNKGDRDSHLPLGDGNIDFAALFNIFEKRDENPAYVLEPNNIAETQKSLSYLRGIVSIE